MSKPYHYFKLVKFSHTLFALPFAMIGVFLAFYDNNHQPDIDWWLFLKVILCMVFARNTAMAFNRYVDREIDKKNPRTAMVREIPSGTIRPRSVLVFVIANAILFITTTFFINKLCFFLSPIALLVVMGYSYTKRFTVLCHFILGVGLSLAPIGAYIAVTERFDLLPLLFSILVLFWVSGFDIIYALQDASFDRANNLYALPSFLGSERALVISKALHFMTIVILFFVFLIGGFGYWYLMGAIVFSFLLIRQHRVINKHGLKKINLVFFTFNGIASIIYSAFVIIDLVV